MSQGDIVHSPFRAGFAALGRDPALLAAELTWRWCFGFSAWLLAIVAAALFLDSLTLSRGDQFLLSTLQPVAVRQVAHHVFQGSLLRLIWLQAILLFGIALLWSFAATAGRAATLRRMLEFFRADEGQVAMTWQFRPIFCLNLLRATWSVVAVAAMIASLALGIAMAGQQHAGRAAFFLVFGITVAGISGYVLNWLLGLAPLFCIRDGSAAHEAFALAVDFCSERGGRILGISQGFLLMRMVWAGTMFLFLLSPLGVAKYVAPGWVVFLMGVAMLIYCAGADVLYLARMGAYLALSVEEEPPAAPPAFVPECFSPPELLPGVEPA
jgi:hypothetical protein